MWRLLTAVLLLLPAAADARMKAGPVVMSPHVRAWSAGVGGGGGSDPNFASVVLLLHLDGADGSTTFTDSTGRHAVFAGGSSNSKLTTAQVKFGTASLDSVTTSFITSANHVDWNFGAGQFTVECWVRSTAAISGLRAVQGQWGGTTNLGWRLGFNGTAFEFFYSITGTDFPSVSANYSPPLNQWVHLAADRDASNVLRIYADGVVIASASAAATVFNSTQQFYVGNDSTVSWPRAFIGQIDDVRLTKGVGRYGGAFTPPTGPFPNN